MIKVNHLDVHHEERIRDRERDLLLRQYPLNEYENHTCSYQDSIVGAGMRVR